MQPVYPSTETLTNRGIDQQMMQQLWKPVYRDLPDYLIAELKLDSKKAVLFNIHFPKALRFYEKKPQIPFSSRNCSYPVTVNH
jgi:ATP-dependent DNA helicase RecG